VAAGRVGGQRLLQRFLHDDRDPRLASDHGLRRLLQRLE